MRQRQRILNTVGNVFNDIFRHILSSFEMFFSKKPPNRNDHAYRKVCRRPNLPFIWISWRQDQPAFSCKENRCLNHVAPFGNELNGDQRPPHCLTIAS
ncbi:hypothetical protein pdam_00007665 [Pocillopora damicornis]|uniref:Uncharacterized protein n=1 Tax=Pocillopora damicornis TaxID=46731 RepID=A0A3M6TZM5_POCDA|nr:hypothetical protein pdam_00007665 [Pocillopora damicornis]